MRPRLPSHAVKELLAHKRKDDQERAERRKALDPKIFPQVGDTPSRKLSKSQKKSPAPPSDIFGRIIKSTDGSTTQRTLQFPKKMTERTDKQSVKRQVFTK